MGLHDPGWHSPEVCHQGLLILMLIAFWEHHVYDRRGIVQPDVSSSPLTHFAQFAFQADEDEVDADDWSGLLAALNWQPDPVEVDLVRRTRERSSDIITMLVAVYGSKELFISEYRCGPALL
jgi:hypothetical protein